MYFPLCMFLELSSKNIALIKGVQDHEAGQAGGPQPNAMNASCTDWQDQALQKVVKGGKKG